jgi:tetratricopeptide (TPR) repeat protein
MPDPPHPVFISYSRSASAADAQALASRLGDLVRLDTTVDEGDHFPQFLLDAILDARVVVIFATHEYMKRRFCRLEMRLALAGGGDQPSHIVLALGEGSDQVLDGMPSIVGLGNWPPAGDTERVAKMVRESLQNPSPPIRDRLTVDEARKLAEAFLDQSGVPEPHSLHGIACSLPAGVAGQSLDTRFVGRAEDLRRIHRILSQGNGSAARLTSRITAGAGFGKTRLAVEYLHRYGQYYPGGVFWVNAAAADLDGEFWRVLSAIKPDLPDLAAMRAQGRDIRRELEKALRAIEAQTLYVVDNIPEAAKGEDPPGVGEFCPALGAITVLATSRQDTREEGVKPISIKELDREPAVLLLTEGVPGSGTLSWADWERIAEWVGDLPIALDLLNRSLALQSISSRDLLGRAVSAAQPLGATGELDQLREALRGQVPKGAVRGVTEAFSISFEKLDGAAQEVASILAQLAPAPLPEEFIAALPRELNSPAVRTALRSRHFVTSAGDRSFGVMHRLMVDFLRGLAGQWTEADLLLAACGVVGQAMTRERCRDPRQWPLMNLCRPHAETLLVRGMAHGASAQQASEIGLEAAFLAGVQGDAAGAQRLQQQVLEASTRVLGEEHPATLKAKGELASTLAAHGDRARGLQLQEHVLEASTRVSGAEHPATLRAMGELALSLAAQGEHVRARELEERALEASRRVLGEEHPATLTAMKNLAITLAGLGDQAAAQKIEERLLEARKRLFGEEHPSTLIAMNTLAITLAAQGDHAGAQQIEERVLEVNRRVLGEEHPNTLKSIGELAATRAVLGDHAGAQQLQERVLEVSKRILGDEHPNTLKAMSELASTLAAQGDQAGAREIQERVLDIGTRVLGEEHPYTLRTMAELASTMAGLGDRASAQQLQERVLEVSRRVLGADHPSTLRAMGERARTLAALGNHATAQQLQERVLEARTRVLGEEHPATLSAMGELALTLAALGDRAGAQRLQERALEGKTRVLGAEHPATLIAMGELARTLATQHDFAGAQRLQEQVLAGRTRVLGEEHPNTLRVMGELARTRAAQGDYAGARRIEERVLEISKQVFGHEHPSTLTAMGELARTVATQRDYVGAQRFQEKVLEGRTRVLGEDHPATLRVMGELGRTLAAQRDFEGARRMEERVLEVSTRVLGEEHPATLRAMSELARTLVSLRDYARARRLQERALELSTRVLGEHHPSTLKVMKNLAATLRAQRDFPGARRLEEVLRTYL